MTSKRMKKKTKRQQAALQRVVDISERLGLYEREDAELDYLFDRDTVNHEQGLVRKLPEPKGHSRSAEAFCTLRWRLPPTTDRSAHGRWNVFDIKGLWRAAMEITFEGDPCAPATEGAIRAALVPLAAAGVRRVAIVSRADAL